MKNYTSFERNEWAKLAPKNKVDITKEELADIKSLGDVVDLTDVHEIYGQDAGSKYNKAEQLGIPLLTEEEAIAQIK